MSQSHAFLIFQKLRVCAETSAAGCYVFWKTVRALPFLVNMRLILRKRSVQLARWCRHNLNKGGFYYEKLFDFCS